MIEANVGYKRTNALHIAGVADVHGGGERRDARARAPFARARKSGTVRLALCASTMRSMGNPTARAQTAAKALPRLPAGMMYEAFAPVRRSTSRLDAA